MSLENNKFGNSCPTEPVRIEKLVPGGDGLGHIAGGVVFVPLTAPGDLVSLKKVRRRKGVRFAEVRQILEASARRRQPPCPWFGTCGGCQWMHMDYEHQLSFKGEILQQALRGIARLQETPPLQVHAAPEEFRYRYRARMHIKGTAAGFYRSASNRIVSWDSCMLLPEEVNLAVSCLRGWLRENPAPGELSSCEMAISPADRSMTINWLFSGPSTDMGAVRKIMDGLESALNHVNLKLLSQAAHSPVKVMVQPDGSGLPLDVMGIRMCASPGTFFQVNPRVNEMLVQRVLEHLRSSHSRSLLDLYCGNGNFSLPAAASGIRTTGVESSPGAVQDAVSVSGPGCSFTQGNAAGFLKNDNRAYDAVIVDPPRTGLPAELTGQLEGRRFPVLIYVSCEPSTLARDLARLVKGGYAISDMELFDMFPQTSHFETLVVMKG